MLFIITIIGTVSRPVVVLYDIDSSFVSCLCHHVAVIKRTQSPLIGMKSGNLHYQHCPVKVRGAELNISHTDNKESGMRRVLQERAQPTY